MSQQAKLPRLLFRVKEVWELSKGPLQITSDITDARGYRSGDIITIQLSRSP